MSICINYCFSIGYRCTADEFMEKIKIRNCSGPFSYMVCDLESSLHFIENNFDTFTDVVSKPHHGFKWNGRIWNHHLYFNKAFIPENDNLEINTIPRMCVWNHHNLDDATVIQTIKRRCLRLLHAMKSNKNVLYLHINNIKIYESDNWENYVPFLKILEFVNKQINCYFLILIPLLQFNKDPILYRINKFINVIFYKSNMEGNINDIDHPAIPWNTIKDLIFENYVFELESDDAI